MTIYISGGSNSLAGNGWVSRFRNVMGPEADIQNISIGAAPSHMGAYRCLSTVELSRGDTVVWEYGINDANHILHKGMDEGECLRAVEWMIEGCSEKGVALVAAIFQPREVEQMGGMSSYRLLLREMFDKYGIRYLDLSEAYRSRHGMKRIPWAMFQDRVHYDEDSPLMDFVAEEVAKLVRAAPEPAPHPVVGKKPQFYKDFSGGNLEWFENSVLQTNVWAPGRDGLRGQLARSGRAVGVVLISTQMGGAFDLELAGQSVRFSAAFREKVFLRPMLKFVCFPSILGHDIHFQAGDAFSLKWADSAEGMLADAGFKKKLGRPALMGREARIVAFMTEE